MDVCRTFWCLSLALALLTGCADNQAVAANPPPRPSVSAQPPAEPTSTGKTLLLDSGDIFVSAVQKNGAVSASYFSMEMADGAALVQRIVWILKTTGAKPTFIKMVETRLPGSRYFQNENFTMPLRDEQGNEHRFEYRSNIDGRMYSLNYQTK